MFEIGNPSSRRVHIDAAAPVQGNDRKARIVLRGKGQMQIKPRAFESARNCWLRRSTRARERRHFPQLRRLPDPARQSRSDPRDSCHARKFCPGETRCTSFQYRRPCTGRQRFNCSSAYCPSPVKLTRPPGASGTRMTVRRSSRSIWPRYRKVPFRPRETGKIGLRVDFRPEALSNSVASGKMNPDGDAEMRGEI